MSYIEFTKLPCHLFNITVLLYSFAAVIRKSSKVIAFTCSYPCFFVNIGLALCVCLAVMFLDGSITSAKPLKELSWKFGQMFSSVCFSHAGLRSRSEVDVRDTYAYLVIVICGPILLVLQESSICKFGHVYYVPFIVLLFL